MGTSCTVQSNVSGSLDGMANFRCINDDLKRSVSKLTCKQLAKLSSGKPVKARLVATYSGFYDEVIHKRILKFPEDWAEIHGSYGENTCVKNSDVDFMRLVGDVFVSPSDINDNYKIAYLVVTDPSRMPPGSCWLRLFYTNARDAEFSLPEHRNGLEWFMNCQNSAIRGYARPYCRGSIDDQHTHYPYTSKSDKILCMLPLLKTDKFGRLFFNRAKFEEFIGKQGLTYLQWFNKLLPKWTAHGPANSQKYFGLFDVDVVDAFHCSIGWPNSAKGWLTRSRKWPDEKLVEEISKSGFHVIPICSKMPETEDPDLEWRLSFRTAETILVRSFNKYQRLCFIALKILVKEFIQPKYPEEDFMSSYTVKMLVFWLSEENGERNWTEENFINCLSMCLQRLKQWLHDGFCPSYFIPEYNLFRTKLERMFLLGFREWLISEINEHGWTIIYQCPSLKMSRKFAKLFRTN